MNDFLYILFSLHFLNDGARTAIVALLPFVSKDLHFNFTQVGFLGASQGILGAILAFPAGFFAAKIGGFRVLLFCLLAYALGILIIGASPNILMFGIAFYIATIGFGMFHVIGFSLISRFSPKGKIGRNLGNFTAFGDVGRVILPAVAIFAVSALSWRGSYFGIGILALSMFLIVLGFSIRSNSQNLKTKTTKTQNHREWMSHALSLLTQKKMRLVVAASVIDGLAGSPIYIFLPFLILSKGINATMLGIFTGVYFIGSLFGKSVLGRGVDRFGNAKVFIVAEVLMAFFLITLVWSHDLIFVGIVAFFLGLFARGTTPVITTLFSEVAHADHYEKVFAVSETMLSITAAVAPVSAGVIADHVGIKLVYYFSALLAVLATLPIFFLVRDKSLK